MSDILLRRPPAGTPRLLLTARQAADALAISPRTLWALTARGEVPAIRLPGRGAKRPAVAIRYSVEDLQRWIERVKTGQTVRPAE